MKSIKNGIIYYNSKFVENKVIIFDEKIIDIIDIEDYEKLDKKNFDEYDAQENYVLPGFIDIHIHGYKGYDVMNMDGISKISKELLQNGVTSFLPTTMTSKKHHLQEVCDNIRKAKLSENKTGAKILGVHLEGPYINKEKKGSQNEKYIVLPDDNFIKKNIDVLKIVTIAPEIENALCTINKYKDKINFQIGHTNATFLEANNGIKSGAKGFTHTFNAMTGIHHRDLGAVGACLSDENVYLEIICDNVHVDKSLYKFILKNKDINKILLVTDCISAGGCEDGLYDLSGLDVILNDNVCTLKDGTLAGSTLSLNIALKNFVENTNESLENCVKLVSENQAKYLGLENQLGKIEKGFYSDIVIMNEKYEIVDVFLS